jgi:hypothetical protein
MVLFAMIDGMHVYKKKVNDDDGEYIFTFVCVPLDCITI